MRNQCKTLQPDKTFNPNIHCDMPYAVPTPNFDPGLSDVTSGYHSRYSSLMKH